MTVKIGFMRFTGRSKRILESNFFEQYQNQFIFIGIPITPSEISRLKSIGFENIEHGATILPSAHGKITRINAHGYYIIQKNLPKETVYHTIPWDHEEWRGRDRERVTSYIDRSYQKYPREFVPPPSKEIFIFKTKDRELAISEKLHVTSTSSKDILHYINIFLEIFGYCNIYNENLEIASVTIKKVNWKIFPRGHLDQRFFENNIETLIAPLSDAKQKMIKYRYNFLNAKSPNFIAVGKGGFKGYLVFAFQEKGIFILESLYHGNATYIFDENWESLSKLTKGEILSNSLQRDRIIHLKNWVYRINQLFI